MGGPDLTRRLTEPLQDALAALLTRHGVGAPTVTAALELVDVARMVAVGAVAAVLAVGLRAVVADGLGRRARVVMVAAAGLALALLIHVLRRHDLLVHELFLRGDHLLFVAVLGGLLGGVPASVRAWVLAAVSVAVMWQHCGPVATPVVLGTSLASFVLLGARGGLVAPLFGAGIVAVYAFCWSLRPDAIFSALQTFGLFSFVVLRQISAAASLAGSPRPGLGGYLCYLTFYPGGYGPLGGPEVYADFARRNLGPTRHHEPWQAARGVASGMLQVWAAARVPVSAATLYASPDTLAAWGNALLLFASVALYAMGVWALIDASALFLGYRLHPNFRAILTRQNPSELWWAWRGSLTNWLVRHVYAPLGANRRRTRNILAAFAVSWVWHLLGVPFLTPRFTLFNLAPITLWAAVNATAVVAHVHVREAGLHVLPSRTPPALRRAIHMFLTACLGTCSVTLLHCQGDLIGQFVPIVRLLLGLHR